MEPVTIGIGVALAAGWWASRKKPATPVAPDPAPGCTSADVSRGIQSSAASAVSGAVAGSAAPGIGTGVGAGLGAGLGAFTLLSGPCGKRLTKEAAAAIHNAGLSVCEKADLVYAKIRAANGTIPGWAHMSCDQKLAACLALASPMGVVVVGVTSAERAAEKGIESVTNTATHSNTSTGTHGTTVAGHRIF